MKWHLVALGVSVLACAGERVSPGPESPGPAPVEADAGSNAERASDASVDVAVTDAGATADALAVADATLDAPSAATDAGAGDAGDAGAKAERPLVLAGVRKCTADEEREGVCKERANGGTCLDGYCVTVSTCARYCKASAARTRTDCWTDPKECGAVAECRRAIREANAHCAELERRLTQDCVSLTCQAIRMIDSP